MRAGLFPRGRKGWIFVEYLIGVDLGTSGTKTVLFDVDGNVVASKTIEYPLYQEKNGWAEQDPLDWWNAAAEEQAINRTHRIGQPNPVFCYRLISRGTIEEKMLELQARKQKLSSSLISSDGDALKNLTEDEIRELLG